MVWYRVRVSESQGHTTTTKYTEYTESIPPGGGPGRIDQRSDIIFATVDSNPGRGDSHIKMTGVLVVPFRGQKLYIGTP